MKTSIIIPIYNAEKYLERCLNSTLNQTYKNLEIICVDDGSTDNSGEICDEFAKKDSRVKVVHKQNNGVSSARNTGIELATGEYITFVDADDWIESDYIETLCDCAIVNNVEVVRGNFSLKNYAGKTLITGKLYNLSNKKLNKEDILNEVMGKFLNGKIQCYTWLLLIKRSTLDKIELFNTNLYLMEDTEFYLRLFLNISSTYFLEKPIYNYFENENSCTKSPKYYLRNMYNVIDVNKYMTDTLDMHSCYDRYQEILNTTHCKIIFNNLFATYNIKNDLEITNNIKELLNDEQMQSILDNTNENTLPIHMKIPITLVKKNKIKSILFFYKIRKLLSKLKSLQKFK